MKDLSGEVVICNPDSSTLALQRIFHGTKKYQSNPSSSYKNLTNLAVKYKAEKKSQDLQQILSLTEKLIYKVMESYNISRFPPSVVEDLFADCQTLVLLKCIETFNPEKAGFSTHLSWQLKSFLNYRNDMCERRRELYDAMPIDNDNTGGTRDYKESETLSDISTFSSNTMVMKERAMAEIFS